jgi:FlgD Ig-like domain/Carboxypeptidase regulatory-like domain
MPGTYNLNFEERQGDDSYPYQVMEKVLIEQDLEMNISLDPGMLVSGLVVDPDNEGVEGCWINFYREDGSWGGVSAMSGRDGSFETRLVAGDYYMSVQPVKGFFPDSVNQKLSLSEDTSVKIVLRPGVKVYGRVADVNGKPLPGVTISLVPQATEYLDPENIFPWYRTADYDVMIKRMPSDEAYGSYAWTDVNGYYEVTVRSGIYDLYAWPLEKTYLSRQLQGLELTSEKQVDLTLDIAEITIHGKIEDPDGGFADSVLVSVYDEKTGNLQTVYTDETGAFELTLRPGNYEVFVDGSSQFGESEVIESLEFNSDSDMNVRLGTGLLDSDGDPEASLPELPKAFQLGCNYPNPFNPSTTINYDVVQPTQVTLAVYNIRGRLIKTLVERLVDAGTHTVQWNGKDSSGRAVASGVYFYRMQADGFNRVRKMVLLK